MGYELTGKKVSLSYNGLVQYIDGNYYDGNGQLLSISDSSILNTVLVQYISEASLNNTQFFWNNGILDVSVIGGSGVSQSYVDAADNLIKARYIPDSSLNQSKFKWIGGYLEPSIASGSGDVTKIYVDGSLALRDVSINNITLRHNVTESSVGILSAWRIKDEASMGVITSRHNITEASLNIIKATYIPNASLNQSTFTWTNGILDVSVVGGSGVSQTYVDSSLRRIQATYIPNVSLGSNFVWNGGILEVSVGSGTSDVTKAYVDSSLSIRDGSISWLFANKSASTHLHDGRYVKEVSLSNEFAWAGGRLYVDVSVVQDGASRIYVDGSLAFRDASINWLSNNRLDASLDYTTYQPKISDVSFYYTGDLVSEIITVNNLGTKTVSFLYDINNDVSSIIINNYGVWEREVTFEKDVNENIIAVHTR